MLKFYGGEFVFEDREVIFQGGRGVLRLFPGDFRRLVEGSQTI
jgi:hypothetical protein